MTSHVPSNQNPPDEKRPGAMLTSVVAFGDGSEERESWPGVDSPARALTAAVTLAELQHHGADHAGAWLYLTQAEDQS